MKPRIFAFFLFSFTVNVLSAKTACLSFGAPDTPKVTQVYEISMPLPKSEKAHKIQAFASFPGGKVALLEYLSSNIVYPELARTKNIQGTVVVTFVINKDGRLSDILITKDIGGGCGEEVLRVLAHMPNWLSGKANRNAVNVRYTLPVQFKLEEDKPKRKRN